MEPKVNYALVGLFVALLGTAALAVVVWLSKGNYRGEYTRYYTYMKESVSGLSVDATVKYHGVAVGRVKEIILSPENPEQVRLALDIIRGTPVKQDTLAVLETQGLTGLTTVDLTGGTRDSPPLAAQAGQEHPVINSGPSLFARFEGSLSRLLADDAVPRLLGNLNGLTQDARVVVDEQNRKALRQVLADLADVTRTLAARRAELDSSIVRAGEALESFADLGKKMDERLPEIIDQTSSSLRALQNMTQEVGRAGAALNAALDGNRANIDQFTGQTLADAGILVADLRQLTATLQRVAKELEEEPSLLVFGRPRQRRGPGE